jgi:hypothetical protein
MTAGVMIALWGGGGTFKGGRKLFVCFIRVNKSKSTSLSLYWQFDPVASVDRMNLNFTGPSGHIVSLAFFGQTFVVQRSQHPSSDFLQSVGAE